MNIYLADYRDFDINLIEFTNSKYNNDAKCYEIMLLCQNKPLIIKAPKLYIQKILKDETNPDSILDIELELMIECDDFYKFIINLENHIKNKIANESLKCIGVQIPREGINNLYHSMLSLPISIKKYPYIKISWDNNCSVFNKSNEIVNTSLLQENNEVMALIKFNKINMYKNKIALDVSLHTIKIFNQITQISEYMFDDSDSNEQIFDS